MGDGTHASLSFHFIVYIIYYIKNTYLIHLVLFGFSFYLSVSDLTVKSRLGYNTQAFEELEDLLAKHNICIAVKEKLVKDSGVAEEIAYDNIVLKLLTKPRARGKYFVRMCIDA